MLRVKVRVRVSIRVKIKVRVSSSILPYCRSAFNTWLCSSRPKPQKITMTPTTIKLAGVYLGTVV